jgi:hypothetical protein
MRYLLAVLSAVAFASIALAQEQLVSTYKEIARTEEGGGYAQAQLILCNNDPNTPGNDSDDVVGALWTTGEWCEEGDPNWPDPNTTYNDPNASDGDWSKGFWAGGYDCIKLHFEEFGTGSAVAKVWNCHLPNKPAQAPHAAQWDPTTEAPDPAVAPTPSLTNNRECEELTLGETLDGQTTRYITICEVTLGMIYGEIDTCTTDCSSRLSVSVGH